MKAVIPATLQPPAWPSCPPWCAAVPRDNNHPGHWATVADWEGPGRLLVEVGIGQRVGAAARVVVESETYDENGDTVEHTVTEYTPGEALAMARHPVSDTRLAAALVEAARLLGAEQEGDSQ